jgi:hypothetical protein
MRSALSLLVSRILANDIHLTTSSDNPTVFTSLLD